ncbi:MAG TPA: PKD domain-containing protein [bacterium]|nr:PKD domain-containing protein [bacterium]HPN43250.1 PKD domain-containing protein [bacterium]
MSRIYVVLVILFVTVACLSQPSKNSENERPVAYAGQDIITFSGQKTTFYGSGSSPENDITFYEWDFDGDRHVDYRSTIYGPVEYSYPFPGSFQAILTVHDISGNHATDAVHVQVRSGAGPQEYATLPDKIPAKPTQIAAADETVDKYVILLNGSSEARFWNDMTFMYYDMLQNFYNFKPASIFVFNYDGLNPSGSNPDNLIDYPATKIDLDAVFTDLEQICDTNDQVFIFTTSHGYGYDGPESVYYGYLSARASVDHNDNDKDYLENDFKLRSLFTGGDYRRNHGMDNWACRKEYYTSKNSFNYYRNKYVSHFTNIYFENQGTVSDNDVFIERFVDYLKGDTNKDGYISSMSGAEYDYDGDGNPPYNPATGVYDEDDWGTIDELIDNYNYAGTSVPGNNYMLFDAGLDNHLDIDINYNINYLEADGTDTDNQGLYDGLDVNDDGDMNDWVSIDEAVMMYDGLLFDDQLAEMAARLPVQAMTFTFMNCFSGGFINDLSSTNRVIMTPTTEELSSWDNDFIRNVIWALKKSDNYNIPVDADDDNNGFISFREAFNFSAVHDPHHNETPMYDDNGDHIGHSYPVPSGGDGYFGNSVYLYQFPKPVANFQASPVSGIFPLLVHFTDRSTGFIDKWEWDFGDNASGSEQNPDHTFNYPGTYTVSLTVSGLGGSHRVVKNSLITIGYPPPVADFSAFPVSGIMPLTVQFSSLSTGFIQTWLWSFGDGVFSNQQNPLYTYNNPGNYSVNLSVVGPGGSDQLNKESYISVLYPPPAAEFTAEPTSGVIPLTVQFTNFSTGQISSYLWKFGDGDSSVTPNPTHTYTIAGSYSVSLYISGPGGNDSITKESLITVMPLAPHADFTAAPVSGPRPLIVQFTSLASGFIDLWLWKFGDGDSCATQNPVHTYTSAGSYSVSLTVNGPGGSHQLTKPDFISVTLPLPLVDFSAAPLSGPFPLTVRFTNLSSGDIHTWSWRFGDGDSSSLQNPEHTYLDSGKYTVSLQATGPGGSQELVKEYYIQVTVQPPVAEFTATPVSGYCPLTVKFENMSSGEITTCLWKFGDGDSSTLMNTEHTYRSCGKFSVSFMVSGSGGIDIKEKTDYIHVKPPKFPQISITPHAFVYYLNEEDLPIKDSLIISNLGDTTLQVSGIEATVDWISIPEPANLVLAPGLARAQVFILNNSNEFTNDIYNSNILIHSNDPDSAISIIPVVLHLATSISAVNISGVPDNYELSQNYPNPFNSSTSLLVGMPHSGHAAISIFTMQGKLIKTVLNTRLNSGYHSIAWNGTDKQNLAAPSGIYVLHFQSGNFSKNIKMILLK